MIRTKAGAIVLVLLAALVVGGAAAARTPTPSQKAAITAALRSEQGDVAIQKILVSTADPSYADIGWGFSNAGRVAQHDSLVGRTGKGWKILWTRDIQQPADGACIYVPAPVAHDLLAVKCPPARLLHARSATKPELTVITRSFHRSNVTPYSRNSTGLSHVCVSRIDQTWAGAVAGFDSGATIYIFFRKGKPVFESLLQQGTPPPAKVVLSLASCVGYNPADYNA
jgi:hypothetical protein